MKNNKYNQGQIAIVVLLASALLLTLGLSASRKTVTDTKIDIDEELLKEAFNTAESGINNYLETKNPNYSSGADSSAIVSSSSIGGGTTLSSEGKVIANSSQLFWLVNHEMNGDIGTSYYSSNFSITPNFTGALKVNYFYIDAGGVYQVIRLGCRYDGGSNPAFANGFSNSCSNISVVGRRPLLVTVTPLGGDTTITISGSSPFPLQGEELTSVGTVNNSVNTQVKTRNIYEIPIFFTEAVTVKDTIQ